LKYQSRKYFLHFYCLFNLYINLACLGVCLSVCLFVSNKRLNGCTDRAQFFCGTSRDSREGFWIMKISNICLHQNSIVNKFFKILKIREIFCENPRIIFVLFYDVHKERFMNDNNLKKCVLKVFHFIKKFKFLIIREFFF